MSFKWLFLCGLCVFAKTWDIDGFNSVSWRNGKLVCKRKTNLLWVWLSDKEPCEVLCVDCHVVVVFEGWLVVLKRGKEIMRMKCNSKEVRVQGHSLVVSGKVVRLGEKA